MYEIVFTFINHLDRHPSLGGVISGVLGFAMLSLQIYMQHSSTLSTQSELVKANLKIDIIKEFSELATQATQKRSGVPILELPGELERDYRRNGNLGLPMPMLFAKAEKISEMHKQDISAHVKLLFFMERYETIIPGLADDRKKLGCQIGTLHSRFTDIEQELLTASPLFSETTVTHKSCSNDFQGPHAKKSSLDIKCQSYFYEHLTLQSHVSAISSMMKNELLGKIFDGRVETRRPLLPSKHKVLKTT